MTATRAGRCASRGAPLQRQPALRGRRAKDGAPTPGRLARLLVRHGTTALTAEDRFAGSTDVSMLSEPWLLAASTRLADWPAKRLVKVSKQRMQIELSFRDMKSQHFGEGLECSASKGAGRFTVLVLIASLAAILLWLIGTAAERSGLHERLRPNTRKRRAYSRVFLARGKLGTDHVLYERGTSKNVVCPPLFFNIAQSAESATGERFERFHVKLLEWNETSAGFRITIYLPTRTWSEL